MPQAAGTYDEARLAIGKRTASASTASNALSAVDRVPLGRLQQGTIKQF